MPDDGSLKSAVVSDEMAKKFASEKETPYTRWVRNEGLDILNSLYVKSLYTVELKPWARPLPDLSQATRFLPRQGCALAGMLNTSVCQKMGMKRRGWWP